MKVRDFLINGVEKLPLLNKDQVLKTLLLVFDYEVENKDTVFSRKKDRQWSHRYYVLDRLIPDQPLECAEFKNLVKMAGEAWSGDKQTVSMLKKEAEMLHTGTFDSIMTVDEAETKAYWA